MRITRTKMTPPQVAAAYGVSTDKVLAWIKGGELRALNAATKACGRPRYLIDQADLLAFEQRRTATPTAPAVRRKRQPTTGIIEFF